MIEIPHFKDLDIRDIVCDYNGTIAKDGIVITEIKKLFLDLSEKYRLHVVTADTFGSVKEQLKGYDVNIKVLSSDNHTREKALYIQSLGAANCIAIGNGNNDKEMLKESAIGIAVLGSEGCAKEALLNSDMLCKDIKDALLAVLHSKRLIATLRN